MSNSDLYSTNTEGKFLFIRHGQSIYNVEMEEKGHTMELKLNRNYIDVSLSDLGIKQSKSVQETVNKLNIVYAYVSPLYRTLQTAANVLETYPNKNLKVIVHPFISECLNNIDDYVCDIQQSKKEFNMESNVKFDWSLFDSIYKTEKEQDLYCFERIQKLPKDQIEYIKKKINDSYSDKEKLKDTMVELAKMTEDNGLRRLEEESNLLSRGMKFKEFLKETYKGGDTLKEDEKVLVVTHSSFTQMFTSRKAKTMEKLVQLPDDGYAMKNCEIISIYI